MKSAKQTQWVCEQARISGFDLCGVAPAAKYAELANVPEWLARGYAGEMKYLEDERRCDPRMVLENVQSLIVVALSYNSPQPSFAQAFSAQSRSSPAESPRGWISRYAWGDDYHEVMQVRLKALVAAMRDHFSEPFEARVYVDTGPIVERVAAKHAGLGWLGKNTSLINQHMGSWLFLGVVLTTLVLEPSLSPNELPPPDLCGSCTRCLDACPTQAFPAPYVLDARRCISYLTVELRGSIPEELRASMGGAVVGCDICQDVCPWNRKAPATTLTAFQPRQTLGPEYGFETRAESDKQKDSVRGSATSNVSFLLPDLELLASLSQQEFSALFRGSAVKRAKWRGVVRNACVALGNSRIAVDSEAYSRVTRLLGRLASSDDSLVSGHARWALDRLSAAHAETVSAD
jgi:epoxyqueuosine reductase